MASSQNSCEKRVRQSGAGKPATRSSDDCDSPVLCRLGEFDLAKSSPLENRTSARGSTATTLLDHMRQFMGQQSSPSIRTRQKLPVSHDHVLTDSIRSRLNRRGRIRGFRIVMHPYPAEVMPEPRLHMRPRMDVQRYTGRCKHFVDDRRDAACPGMLESMGALLCAAWRAGPATGAGPLSRQKDGRSHPSNTDRHLIRCPLVRGESAGLHRCITFLWRPMSCVYLPRPFPRIGRGGVGVG